MGKNEMSLKTKILNFFEVKFFGELSMDYSYKLSSILQTQHQLRGSIYSDPFNPANKLKGTLHVSNIFKYFEYTSL